MRTIPRWLQLQPFVAPAVSVRRRGGAAVVRFRFRSLTCAGKLRSLELALQLARVAPEEVGQEYEQLITTYPEELI